MRTSFIAIAIMGVLNVFAQPSDVPFPRNPTNVLVRGMVIARVTGEPLIGVSVLSANSGLGAITNFDGEFEIEIPMKVFLRKADTLSFSYLAYSNRSVPVATVYNKVDLGELQLAPTNDRIELIVISTGLPSFKPVRWFFRKFNPAVWVRKARSKRSIQRLAAAGP